MDPRLHPQSCTPQRKCHTLAGSISRSLAALGAGTPAEVLKPGSNWNRGSILLEALCNPTLGDLPLAEQSPPVHPGHTKTLRAGLSRTHCYPMEPYSQITTQLQPCLKTYVYIYICTSQAKPFFLGIAVPWRRDLHHQWYEYGRNTPGIKYIYIIYYVYITHICPLLTERYTKDFLQETGNIGGKGNWTLHGRRAWHQKTVVPHKTWWLCCLLEVEVHMDSWLSITIYSVHPCTVNLPNLLMHTHTHT